MENVVKTITSAVATCVTYLFGGWDLALQALVIVIVLDYLTGIVKGYVTKTLNSKTGFRGFLVKVCMLAMVVIATIMDSIMGETGLIRTLVIYYLVANEALSIIENLGAMDLFVPKILKDRLEQLKEGNKGEKK